MYFGHFGTCMLHCYFHISGMFQAYLRMRTDRGGWKGVREEVSRVADEKRRFWYVIPEAQHDSCQAVPMLHTSRVQQWTRRFLGRHKSCHLTRVVSLSKLPKISFSKFVNWELLDIFRGQTFLETFWGRFGEKAFTRIIGNHLGNIVTLNL